MWKQRKCTDGCITTALPFSSIFCSFLHQLPACCFIVSGPDPLSLEMGDVTRWNIFFFFFFQRVHPCSKTDMCYPIPYVCVCVYICWVRWYCKYYSWWLTVQPPGQYSRGLILASTGTNADWHRLFVFPPPHRHRLFYWNTQWGWRWGLSIAVSGGFLFCCAPLAFCLCCQEMRHGGRFHRQLLSSWPPLADSPSTLV